MLSIDINYMTIWNCKCKNITLRYHGMTLGIDENEIYILFIIVIEGYFVNTVSDVDRRNRLFSFFSPCHFIRTLKIVRRHYIEPYSRISNLFGNIGGRTTRMAHNIPKNTARCPEIIFQIFPSMASVFDGPYFFVGH